MRPVYFYLAILPPVLLLSCVSTGKFKAMQQESQKYDSLYTWSQRTLKTCQDANTTLSRQKTSLQDQMNSLNLELSASKENNTILRKQLQDISALSSAQAESIKKSLDNMGANDIFIRELQSAIKHRDSVNLAVIMNLKAYLGNLGDQDMHLKVWKGTVSVDFSDSLLFNGDSGSYALTDKGKAVLGRLARALNNGPDVEFMVEGHTDSLAYQQGELLDNWDLSAKRATSVVRILQNQYNIAPQRMTAAGRSEYVTVGANDTPEGRSANRRTRIIFTPQVDQLLWMLERRQGQAEPAGPVGPASAPVTSTP
jgi:chemotaxis protein MotB